MVLTMSHDFPPPRSGPDDVGGADARELEERYRRSERRLTIELAVGFISPLLTGAVGLWVLWFFPDERMGYGVMMFAIVMAVCVHGLGTDE
jgi:hypothetical protein